MSLKIGAIPDRTPVKVTASLPPDVHDALQDYAAIHTREFGQEAPESLLSIHVLQWTHRLPMEKRSANSMVKVT